MTIKEKETDAIRLPNKNFHSPCRENHVVSILHHRMGEEIGGGGGGGGEGAEEVYNQSAVECLCARDRRVSGCYAFNQSNR